MAIRNGYGSFIDTLENLYAFGDRVENTNSNLIVQLQDKGDKNISKINVTWKIENISDGIYAGLSARIIVVKGKYDLVSEFIFPDIFALPESLGTYTRLFDKIVDCDNFLSAVAAPTVGKKYLKADIDFTGNGLFCEDGEFCSLIFTFAKVLPQGAEPYDTLINTVEVCANVVGTISGKNKPFKNVD